MQQGLVDPIVACIFGDWSEAVGGSQSGLQLLMAPGPSAALICLPLPKVTPHNTVQTQNKTCFDYIG